MRFAGFVVVPLLATALAACAEPLEFAPWTIAVPEGTIVHEYAPVSEQHRADRRVELVEDLVIGERGDDLNYAFGALPLVIDVDADGNIYVLDPSAARLQVFDAAGAYRFTLGSEGQGPGEFSRPRAMAVTGDAVVVYDSGNGRFSRFDLQGEHLGDSARDSPSSLMTLAGSPDGTLLSTLLPRDGPGEEFQVVVARLGAGGEQIAELTRGGWPDAARYVSRSGERISVISVIILPQPDLALDPGTAVYFSTFEEYQLLRFDPDGTVRWALRVAAPRTLFSGETRQFAMGLIQRRYPDAAEDEIDWPEANYVLAGLEVDGHGHVYVFPYTAEPTDNGRPVDVYSADGERLFAGTMPAIDWQAARGDYVYASGRDDNDERQVVRYRIVEPFDR